MSNDTKALVIGLDGGCLDLIGILTEKGVMPRLSALIRQGVCGKLESVFPPITAPAWVSFMTGKNPGKHGVFNFFKNLRDLDNRQIVSHDSIKTETLISIANDSGKKVASINMPVTYPPSPVNGYIISGMFTPSLASQFTHPPGLYDELKEKLGEYVIAVPFQRYDERHTDRFLEDALHCMHQRTKYGLEIMGRLDWDLFMLVFTSTDYVQHAMWDYFPQHLHSTPDRRRKKLSERLMDFYRELDGSIGKLLDNIDEDTQVFIISDHGFGPLDKKFFVSAWLEQLGLLHFSRDAGSRARRMAAPVLGRMRRVVTKLDRYDLRYKLRGGARKFTFDKIFDFIDWSKTKAVCGSYSEQGIYINTKGSWPNGVVSPGKEYDDIREFILSELRNLKDPATGATLVVDCYRREDIYTGSHVEEAPDIVFMLEKGACIADNMPSKVLFDKPNRIHGTGFHRAEGMLVASGKGIKKGGTIGGARIIDVAPTVLCSMGLEIPHDADGVVLRDLFEPEFSSATTERFREPTAASGTGADEAYSDEDSKKIEDRLRGLGYL